MSAKKENGLVSIVTPVYNAEKFLKETIKSVQDQTYKYWELFLINDGSTDKSLEIAEELAKKDHRIKVITINNSGAAVARNTGIERANGQYLCFIDADDLWEPNKLELQLNYMQEHPECAFLYTDYSFADEDGNKNGKVVHVPTSITYKQALKNTTIFTSTVMFNMDKLTKEDVTMPLVRRGQDTATWWKVLKKIDHADGLNESTALYRHSAGTLSSNKIKALKRTWNLYRNVEKHGLMKSSYYFTIYCINAIKRRV